MDTHHCRNQLKSPCLQKRPRVQRKVFLYLVQGLKWPLSHNCFAHQASKHLMMLVYGVPSWFTAANDVTLTPHCLIRQEAINQAESTSLSIHTQTKCQISWRRETQTKCQISWRRETQVHIVSTIIMAKQTTESGGESYELQKLRHKVEELCKSLHGVEDSGVADMDDLRQISEVIEKIKDKISFVPADDGSKKKDDDELLPLSKRKELAEVVPLVEAALKQRMAPGAANRRAADDKDRPSAAAGCNPLFKARASQQQQQQSTQQDEDTAGGGALSLKLLLRLAKNVLEPEQYYEWTTSYVDEERIYGWEKDADDVMESLVAPNDGWERDDPMFRAAGIAGIHGSGKTALAQKVFVHDKAKDNFAIRLWVCVGPPDSEDRFNLLYRMLDNLGLDTGKVEDDIVANAKVVRKAIKEEDDRIRGDHAENTKLREEAAAKVRADRAAGQSQSAEETAVKKEDAEEKMLATDQAAAGAKQQAEEIENPVDHMYKELLKKKVENSVAVQKSKIGVLLYILHVTLSKTSYLIVFDDIRVYGNDGWYSNLTLPPPPEGEWGDRLAYGLPKGGKQKAAVLVTCRKEDDAKSMVRTGRVFRPPKLEVDDAWKLFKREYDQAKKKRDEEKDGKAGKDDDGLIKDDQAKKKGDEEKDGKAKAAAGPGRELIDDLQEMKKEIVNKCLGLPVAIIEAARGFAALEPLPEPDKKKEADEKPAEDNKSADDEPAAPHLKD